MSETSPGGESGGAVRIAPHVLATIASLTALGVPGVARMGVTPADAVGRLVRRQPQPVHGVRVAVDDGEVAVEVYVVLKQGVNFYQTAVQIQHEIAQAITTMVGMPVRSVDVFIQDVE